MLYLIQVPDSQVSPSYFWEVCDARFIIQNTLALVQNPRLIKKKKIKIKKPKQMQSSPDLSTVNYFIWTGGA